MGGGVLGRQVRVSPGAGRCLRVVRVGGSRMVGRRFSELLQEVRQTHRALSGLMDEQGACGPSRQLGVSGGHCVSVAWDCSHSVPGCPSPRLP